MGRIRGQQGTSEFTVGFGRLREEGTDKYVGGMGLQGVGSRTKNSPGQSMGVRWESKEEPSPGAGVNGWVFPAPRPNSKHVQTFTKSFPI